MKYEKDDGTIGYSIKFSMDHETVNIELRIGKEITNRVMIEALHDLADEIESNCEKTSELDQ